MTSAQDQDQVRPLPVKTPTYQGRVRAYSLADKTKSKDQLAALCETICKLPAGSWQLLKQYMDVAALRAFLQELRACSVRYSAFFKWSEMTCQCGESWLTPRGWARGNKVCPARPNCSWDTTTVRVRPLESVMARAASWGDAEECLRLLARLDLLAFYVGEWQNPASPMYYYSRERTAAMIPRDVLAKVMNLPPVRAACMEEPLGRPITTDGQAKPLAHAENEDRKPCHDATDADMFQRWCRRPVSTPMTQLATPAGDKKSNLKNPDESSSEESSEDDSEVERQPAKRWVPTPMPRTTARRPLRMVAAPRCSRLVQELPQRAWDGGYGGYAGYHGYKVPSYDYPIKRINPLETVSTPEERPAGMMKTARAAYPVAARMDEVYAPRVATATMNPMTVGAREDLEPHMDEGWSWPRPAQYVEPPRTYDGWFGERV